MSRPWRDVGYGRISLDLARSGHGVGRQEEDVRATSERTGGELIAFYTDNDISASRYSKKAREGYRKVLEMVEAGAADRIVVYDLDRLLRRPSELEVLIDLVDKRPGFAVVNVTGEIDLTSADGRFIARILVAKAAKESDDISRRIKRQIEQSAALGRPKMSKRAFGYACLGQGPGMCDVDGCDHTGHRVCRVEDCPHDGVSIVPSEAKLLRGAARDVLAGESLTGIARRWNEAGVLTPQTDRPWSTQVVRRVLTGPRHAGLRVHQGKVVGVGNWEPILNRETHEALVRLLLDPERRRKNPPRRQPFTGVLYDYAGRQMNIALTKPKWSRAPVRVYRTDTGRYPGVTKGGQPKVGIAAEPLEALVERVLFLAVESGEVARRAEARRARQPAPAGEDPAAIDAELAELAADYGEKRISRLEWLAARKPLQARLERARAAEAIASGVGLADGIDPDIRRRWRSYSTDRKRAILAAVFERIVVHPATRRGPVFDEGRVEPIWRE